VFSYWVGLKHIKTCGYPSTKRGLRGISAVNKIKARAYKNDRRREERGGLPVIAAAKCVNSSNNVRASQQMTFAATAHALLRVLAAEEDSEGWVMGLGSRDGLAGVDPGLKEADLVSVQTAGMLDHEGGGDDAAGSGGLYGPLWTSSSSSGDPTQLRAGSKSARTSCTSTRDSACADHRIRGWDWTRVG
jgi:hypothetical protein